MATLESPLPFNPGEPMVSIRDRLARIVHREWEEIDNGDIEELSEQRNAMFQ